MKADQISGIKDPSNLLLVSEEESNVIIRHALIQSHCMNVTENSLTERNSSGTSFLWMHSS